MVATQLSMLPEVPELRIVQHDGRTSLPSAVERLLVALLSELPAESAPRFLRGKVEIPLREKHALEKRLRALAFRASKAPAKEGTRLHPERGPWRYWTLKHVDAVVPVVDPVAPKPARKSRAKKATS